MQRLLSYFWSTPPAAEPTPAHHFANCEELKKPAIAFDKLRKKKDELALAAEQKGPESLDHQKYTLLKELVDDIDAKISAFNAGSKGATEKDELERQLAICTFIRVKFKKISADSLKILNQYRDYKKPIGVGTAIAVPIATGVAAVATTGVLAGLAVLFGLGGAREIFMSVKNIDPTDSDTVTLLKETLDATEDAHQKISTSLFYLNNAITIHYPPLESLSLSPSPASPKI